MPYVRLTHEYSYGGQTCQNVYNYASPNIAPTAEILLDLATDFGNVIVPAVKGVQVAQVTHLRVLAYAPNVGFTREIELTGTGNIASIPAGNIPPDIVLLVKRFVGNTFQNANGAPYTGNRPILRGQFYLSGLPKNFMSETGFVRDTFTTEWEAFFDAQEATLVDGNGGVWTPVVHGVALAASGSKDARPLAYAPIVGASAVQFTNLNTRDA